LAKATVNYFGRLVNGVYQHMVKPLSTQLADKWLMAVEIIAQDHQRQLRMILTYPR